MNDPLSRLRRFLRELKRRKVYRAAAGYLVVAFVVLQLADLAADAFGFPGWFEPMVWVVAGLGFPIVLVLAWAFEMTPEGVQRTADAEGASEPESMPAEERRAQSRLPMKALVGLGLVGAAVVGGWYLMGGGGESPEISERTVAVLPFEVSGSGTEEWREGMVTMVSTGLDGAAGLRAIADRTVFATWEQSGPGDSGATTEQALSVARQIGAQYAVVGSAGGLGSELRFAAAVHETETGERLGQVEVRGSPDSVTALAGQLTRRVLGLLAEKTGEELRAADLASVTTRSDTALQAFLAGERHNRAGAYDSAVVDYQAAIRADSSFALPYARLGFLGVWYPEFQGEHIRRAHELSDQLPERQRRLVRAFYLGRFERRTLASRDSLRGLTEDYPDDPMVWFGLGDFIYNTEIPRGLPEVERVLEQARELDPGHTGYHDHYVQAAFVFHHDSAMAAKRVEAVPDEQWRRVFRLGLKMVFGDSSQRRRALTAYDTISIPSLWAVWAPLGAPQNRVLADSVLRRVIEREDVDSDGATFHLFLNDLSEGQIQQALADLRRGKPGEDFVGCRLAGALTLGYPVPDSVAARYLAPENLPEEPSLDRLHCTGLYLLERGGDQLDAWIRRLRATVDTTRPDGVPPGQREAVIQELRGYRAWRRGEFERASELLNRSNESVSAGALWRGDVLRQLGELERAEGWYLAAWFAPVAHERLGRLYEGMGKPEKAAAAYRRFIAAWEDADPELQDRVETARKRLQELKGSGETTND